MDFLSRAKRSESEERRSILSIVDKINRHHFAFAPNNESHFNNHHSSRKMILYTLRVAMQIIIGSFKKTQIVKPLNTKIVQSCPVSSIPLSIQSASNLYKSNSFIVSFRAWPVDLDTYMHVNNACYLRVAELSRWRIFPQSGSLRQSLSKGWIFLAVEQTVSYFKPIPPMAKYIVSTSITATENKWLNYTHIFAQHPDTIKNGKEAIIYARIDLKAVVKEKSGKTVRALDFISTSDFYKELIHVAPVSVSSQPAL